MVILHRLLTACPSRVQTLLCYPVDLLFCTVQRLQGRGFQFSWLIQQRLHEARRWVDAAFPHRHRPAGAWQDDYREVPVIPAPEELFGEAEGRLRPNPRRGAHESAAAYLDLHCRLLREDFLKPLRDGIAAAFSLGGPDSNEAALSLYRGVQLHAVATTPAGPIYLARFPPRAGPAADECLRSGSLTCLLSEDCSLVLFGVVAGVPKQRVAHRDRVWLRIQTYGHRQLLAHLGRTAFTMVESPAFFEAYRHVLEGLQELSPAAVPFSRYLVHCKPSVRRPTHLGADRLFSLTPLLPPAGAEVGHGGDPAGSAGLAGPPLGRRRLPSTVAAAGRARLGCDAAGTPSPFSVSGRGAGGGPLRRQPGGPGDLVPKDFPPLGRVSARSHPAGAEQGVRAHPGPPQHR